MRESIHLSLSTALEAKNAIFGPHGILHRLDALEATQARYQQIETSIRAARFIARWGFVSTVLLMAAFGQSETADSLAKWLEVAQKIIGIMG